MNIRSWFTSEPTSSEIVECLEYVDKLHKQLDGFWQEWSALDAEISKFNLFVNFYVAMQADEVIEQDHSMKTFNGMLKNNNKNIENAKKSLLDKRDKLYARYWELWEELNKTNAHIYELVT